MRLRGSVLGMQAFSATGTLLIPGNAGCEGPDIARSFEWLSVNRISKLKSTSP
jgi:hypothetical protein